MTVPWPPPSPPRPVSRPPSLVAVVVAVVLAMVAQAGTLVALRTSFTNTWNQLNPPPGGSVLPPVPARSPQVPLPLPALPEQSVGPVDLTPALTRGVVLIQGMTPADSVAGTGMIVSPDGYVLTNYHVVRSTSSIKVTIADTGRRITAQMVGRDATKDVAVLKLPGVRNLPTVTLDTDDVTVGDVVIAAGNANGQGYVSAHRGNVQGLGRSINVKGATEQDPLQRLEGLIETNAPAWPGDSGGPMFDADAEVLGMTTAGGGDDQETDRRVYAVPIDEAMAVVNQILAGDESGTVVIGPKAYLGIIVEADDSAAVTVSRVTDGTPAAKAGLRPGDVITAVDGQRVRTRAELSTVLDGIEPGTTITLEWTTDTGQHHSGPITLTAAPLN
ncbi:MAG: trypsin-like peptidase domain-containing protein [Propioniciclava sp.]|uniref:S1C family serine protease n=1 Tax=Propioniciclava sp. TaxID=2038686 RepID=UPI0039E33689